MLEEGKSNYLCAVYLEGGRGGAAFCDISTGEFCCASYETDASGHIVNELGRFAPREAILSFGAESDGTIVSFLTKKLDAMIESGGDGFEYLGASVRLCRQFGFADVDESGLGEAPAAVCAATGPALDILLYLIPSAALAVLLWIASGAHPAFFVFTAAGTLCHVSGLIIELSAEGSRRSNVEGRAILLV